MTRETPLAELLDAFIADRLKGRNPKYVSTYGRAVEWFGNTLGRDPVVGDLDAENIRATMRRIQEAGNRTFWVAKMKTRLASLWKYAFERGIVSHYERIPDQIASGAKNAYLETPPGDDTVTGFYLAKVHKHQSKGVQKDMRAASKNLDRFLGRYCTLEEVTPELLLNFARWLQEKRFCGPTRVERYQAAIRLIVQHWDPSRLQTERKAPWAANPLLPPPQAGSLREFFERRYVPERMIDCREGTIYQARQAMRRLHRHYGRDVLLGELDAALVADHFRWLTQQEGLAAASVNSSHRAPIFAAWRYANEVGEVDTWPRVRRLKEDRHEPDAWELSEVQALIEATTIFEGRTWRGQVPLDAFWRALLLVEYYSALRISALLSVRQCDVNLGTGWLYARPDCQKNRHGKRYRIGPDAVDAVRGIWEPKRELLFEWPYRRRRIWEHFRELARKAAVSDSPLPTGRFHKLRRTAATLAAVHSGLPAAIALLDHSGPEITRRYLDPTKMPGTDATEFLPRPSKAPGDQ